LLSIPSIIHQHQQRERMESPTPSKSRGEAEEQVTPVAGAANTSTIFDSIERYSAYPIAHDAFLKVKYKIEHGTLANSYDIVDTSQDHRRILLNLPGEIKHEYFPLELCTTYAYVLPNNLDGIHFNGDLIEESQKFYVRSGFNDVGDALKTVDGLSYSAIIQETFEHELSHLNKIRHDRFLSAFNKDTPEGPPLHKEAGFGVQRKIRSDQNKAENLLLELSGDDTSRYVAPVTLVWGDLEVTPEGELVSFAREAGAPVSIEELVEHLSYGGLADPTSGGVPVVPPGPRVVPPSSRNKRPRDGDDSEDGGGKLPCSSSEASRARKQVASPLALALALPSTTQKVVPTMKPNIKDEEESLYQAHRSIVSAGKWELFDKMTSATLVAAKFQNEGGVCPDFFSPSDPIYVSLTFYNPTNDDVYLQLARKNFPRGGISVIVKGGERFPNMIAARLPMVAKKLSPQESHTFTLRKLCAGPKVEGDANVRRLQFEFVPYWTPAKAGTYTVEFPLWKKEFSFVVREDADENGGDVGPCSKE
jgi:hypothetical protein